METRKDRFKRLAEKRTNHVLYRLKVLSNLSNKSSYDYSPEEVNKIFRAIDEEIRLVKAKFQSGRGKKFQL